MKKQWRVIVLLAVLAVGLCACGSNETPAESVSAPISATEEAGNEEEASKTLVAVFSLYDNAPWAKDVDVITTATLNKTNAGVNGDTNLLAKVAMDVSNGDLYKIVADKPHPADEEKVYAQAKQEQLDGVRPALRDEVPDMDAYSTVILIYPNWWGGLPMPVCTFLESADLKNKTLIPVCSYDADDSDTEGGVKAIKSLTDAYVTKAYNVRSGGTSTAGTRTDFRNWLTNLPVNY